MAITTTLVGNPSSYGDKKVQYADLTLPTSYAGSAGESLPASVFGFPLEVAYLDFVSPPGIDLRYDYSAGVLHAYRRAPSVGLAVHVKDADGAAAAGVLVYVHRDEVVEQGTSLAHLEFVSPTNVDGSGTLYSGGATYNIQDDDAAATGGVALYLDEDGAAGSRLLANTGTDVYVPTSTGAPVKVTANATPATPGVALYFDEDAVNTYDRLQFVSPTNVDGYATFEAALECPAGAYLGGLTVRAIAYGS